MHTSKTKLGNNVAQAALFLLRETFQKLAPLDTPVRPYQIIYISRKSGKRNIDHEGILIEALTQLVGASNIHVSPLFK